MIARNTMDISELRRLLRYEPDTGIVRWNGRGRLKDGRVAGALDKDGYLVVRIEGHRFPLHRVAFALHTGRWPEDDLDHANGSRTDNRFVNLREASRAENNANSRHRTLNRSGFRGVHWCKNAGKWRVTMTIAGKAKHIGLFVERDAAHAMYVQKAKELYGEFCPKGSQLCA